MEKAILLGKTGGHSQALQVLVHQEGDLKAAEAYCCRAARGRDTVFRQTLLLTLLQMYLSSEDLGSAAVDLLNNHPRVLAAEKVIRLLPDSWSVQLVSQFLVGSLRETFHQRRMAQLQKAMAQVELTRHKVIWVRFFILFHEHCMNSSFLIIFYSITSPLCRCTPQKESSDWIRARNARFVRKTLQSQSLPVTSPVR